MKLTNTHSNLIVALMWLSALYVFYYLMFPFQIIDMKLNENGKLPVLSDKVVAGEDLVVLMEFDKKMNCTPDITYYLVDGFVLRLSDTGITRPVGKNSFERHITIPAVAPADMKVHLRIEYSCELNKLRTIHYSWDTEDFEILKE